MLKRFLFEKILIKKTDESMAAHGLKTQEKIAKPKFRLDKEEKVKKLGQFTLSYKSEIQF